MEELSERYGEFTVSREYQRLQDVSDDQIKKSFELKKRGLQIDRIASTTGLTKHSLYLWFKSPPRNLVDRILESDTLRSLVEDNANLKSASVTFQDSIISDRERVAIPVIDRRGTSTGYSSQHSIGKEAGKGNDLNQDSPVSVTITAPEEKTVDRKLEFTSQTIPTPAPISETDLSVGNQKVLPLIVESKNMVDLNQKLISYKGLIEDHLKAVEGLLSNLDTLAYIESLEDAETEYRQRIENLESEISRLKTVERQL